MTAALLVALAAERALSGSLTGWINSVAGWFGAIAIMLAAHLLLSLQKSRADGAAIMQSLGIVVIRLLSLIILLVVVLVSGFFEVLPFAVGLMTAYFAWSWAEIAFYRQP